MYNNFPNNSISIPCVLCIAQNVWNRCAVYNNNMASVPTEKKPNRTKIRGRIIKIIRDASIAPMRLIN